MDTNGHSFPEVGIDIAMDDEDSAHFSLDLAFQMLANVDDRDERAVQHAGRDRHMQLDPVRPGCKLCRPVPETA